MNKDGVSCCRFRIPTAEINDNYEHPNSKLDYVLENVLSAESPAGDVEFQTLEEQYNSILLSPCICSAENDCNGCFHGGNYELNSGSSKEQVLREGVSDERKTDLIYECSSLCQCDIKKCRNRLVQYGPRKHLRVMDSVVYKSKGLITIKDIPRGGFICEYAGELLTRTEASRRSTENIKNRSSNYILWLNEYEICVHNSSLKQQEAQVTIVDPSRRGNIGRYLNHSCNPNCTMYSIRVDCPVPKIAIFANRDICAGEELCFHYAGDTRSQDGLDRRADMNTYTSCLCNAKNCEKYLPNFEFR